MRRRERIEIFWWRGQDQDFTLIISLSPSFLVYHITDKACIACSKGPVFEFARDEKSQDCSHSRSCFERDYHSITDFHVSQEEKMCFRREFLCGIIVLLPLHLLFPRRGTIFSSHCNQIRGEMYLKKFVAFSFLLFLRFFFSRQPIYLTSYPFSSDDIMLPNV